MNISMSKTKSHSFLFNAIYNIERRIQNERAFRNTCRELSRLSERELLDLNISRSDIPHIARQSVG